MKTSRIVLTGYFFAYLALGINWLIQRRIVAVDAFEAAATCLLFMYLNKKYNLPILTSFFAGFIFVPHVAGIFGLYSWTAINYHYDWIAHGVASLSATIVFADIFYNKYFLKKFFLACFIALSITVTFGALVEASEYWGFIFIGFGEGYLGFGDGDNSQNFGPWENSSLDTTFNFAGSFAAILVYGLFVILRKKEKYRKNPI